MKNKLEELRDIIYAEEAMTDGYEKYYSTRLAQAILKWHEQQIKIVENCIGGVVVEEGGHCIINNHIGPITNNGTLKVEVKDEA